MGRDALASDLAKTAFDAGLIDDAKKFEERMLEGDAAGWNRGHKIHHGNLILGRIAFAEGDIDEAKSRLILAGKTDGLPQLNSFGPNMLLAKELLEKGETATVLQYFKLCKKFWNSPRRELDRWTDDVKANHSYLPRANHDSDSNRHLQMLCRVQNSNRINPRTCPSHSIPDLPNCFPCSAG